ncbi:MAG TPA: phosphatase PAP2 family protein [Telmatospirillum sp.]|nr:phosphatase PAP2 family protein [Telmatospirillum sp.]
MVIFLRTLGYAACLVLSLAMGGADAATAIATESRYVTIAQVDLGQILPPPPSPGSLEEKRDVEAVIDASLRRSPLEADHAHADGAISVLRFADVLGEGFSAENMPFAVPFFGQVASDAHAIVGAAKVEFDRLRPFVVDSRVRPIGNDIEVVAAPRHRSGSYPSGHATFAYVTSVLLAVMVPEKSAEIFTRAAAYAQNRLVAGVHYPTDIDAGRIAGTVIANILLHDSRFLGDFARARTEVRHAAGLE